MLQTEALCLHQLNSFNICSLLCMTLHDWSWIPQTDRPPTEIKGSFGSGHRRVLARSRRLYTSGKTLSHFWV